MEVIHNLWRTKLWLEEKLTRLQLENNQLYTLLHAYQTIKGPLGYPYDYVRPPPPWEQQQQQQQQQQQPCVPAAPPTPVALPVSTVPSVPRVETAGAVPSLLVVTASAVTPSVVKMPARQPLAMIPENAPFLPSPSLPPPVTESLPIDTPTVPPLRVDTPATESLASCQERCATAPPTPKPTTKTKRIKRRMKKKVEPAETKDPVATQGEVTTKEPVTTQGEVTTKDPVTTQGVTATAVATEKEPVTTPVTENTLVTEKEQAPKDAVFHAYKWASRDKRESNTILKQVYYPTEVRDVSRTDIEYLLQGCEWFAPVVKLQAEVERRNYRGVFTQLYRIRTNRPKLVESDYLFTVYDAYRNTMRAVLDMSESGLPSWHSEVKGKSSAAATSAIVNCTMAGFHILFKDSSHVLSLNQRMPGHFLDFYRPGMYTELREATKQTSTHKHASHPLRFLSELTDRGPVYSITYEGRRLATIDWCKPERNIMAAAAKARLEMRPHLVESSFMYNVSRDECTLSNIQDLCAVMARTYLFSLQMRLMMLTTRDAASLLPSHLTSHDVQPLTTTLLKDVERTIPATQHDVLDRVRRLYLVLADNLPLIGWSDTCEPACRTNLFMNYLKARKQIEAIIRCKTDPNAGEATATRSTPAPSDAHIKGNRRRTRRIRHLYEDMLPRVD